jgi:hypothetical protein
MLLICCEAEPRGRSVLYKPWNDRYSNSTLQPQLSHALGITAAVLLPDEAEHHASGLCYM